MVRRILDMGFSTELGKTHRIRVYDVKDTITGAEVAAAMDAIVAKNIFEGTGGTLTGKIDARVVISETTDLTLV